MARFTLKGIPFNTIGELPAKGSSAPEFLLIAKDLSEVAGKSFKGKKVILNIFPSVDTPTCAMSVRIFNREVAALTDTVVLCISMDLPFAHARFCGAEGIENVESLSGFRSDFGKRYGVEMIDGPLKGLFARSIVVLDRNGKVAYTQLVPETADEPDYKSAFNAAAELE
jgi:thioredoxin-dependent peroxiredoxin